MMQTINISLPAKLSERVEKIVEQESYASKSEFFRTLIRLYLYLRTDSVEEEVSFLPFKKQSLSKIKKNLEATNKYSSPFINSVISGLEKSSPYR